MNWLRVRENAAFAKGLMLGKATGVKEERKRIANAYEDKIILESSSLDKLIEIWTEDGAMKEQERIIKVLDEWFADGDNYQEPTSKLIELIKGEK